MCPGSSDLEDTFKKDKYGHANFPRLYSVHDYICLIIASMVVSTLLQISIKYWQLRTKAAFFNEKSEAFLDWSYTVGVTIWAHFGTVFLIILWPGTPFIQ